ncbi:MAG: hypothetical protein WBD46_03880 [Acidobacteriaceae bacterium]
MSKSEAKAAAAEYLKAQAEIMKKYGPAPKLSGRRYEEAKTATAKTFHTLHNLSSK